MVGLLQAVVLVELRLRAARRARVELPLRVLQPCAALQVRAVLHLRVDFRLHVEAVVVRVELHLVAAALFLVRDLWDLLLRDGHGDVVGVQQGSDGVGDMVRLLEVEKELIRGGPRPGGE